MAFIPVNLDDAVEPQPVGEGSYNLQITKCDLQDSKAGKPMFRVSIGFPDEPNTPNMTQFISLPSEEDEPSTAEFKALMLKRFLHLFNISYDPKGIDTEKMAMEMVGASAQGAHVTLGEPNENGDVYNQLTVPRIREEGKSKPRRR